jgi:hypothetical protein
MVPPRRIFQPFFVIVRISRLDHFIPSFCAAASTYLFV